MIFLISQRKHVLTSHWKCLDEMVIIRGLHYIFLYEVLEIILKLFLLPLFICSTMIRWLITYSVLYYSLYPTLCICDSRLKVISLGWLITGSHVY